MSTDPTSINIGQLYAALDALGVGIAGVTRVVIGPDAVRVTRLRPDQLSQRLSAALDEPLTTTTEIAIRHDDEEAR